MKKLFGILILGLFLSGCATGFNPFGSIQNPINNNRLAEIESSYGIALSAAVAYRNTRLCKKTEQASISNVCAYRSVILKLQAADRNVQTALMNARKFIRENPTLDAFSVISVAQQALVGFQAIQAEYGVK